VKGTRPSSYTPTVRGGSRSCPTQMARLSRKKKEETGGSAEKLKKETKKKKEKKGGGGGPPFSIKDILRKREPRRLGKNLEKKVASRGKGEE